MFRVCLISLLLFASAGSARAGNTVSTDYQDPKAVFEFFFADPRHMGNGLDWVRSFMNPLIDEPYNLAPEFIGIVVVIHGTEIVTLAKHNYDKYRDSVERMRYFASLGVQFKVCGLAAADYGYQPDDLHDFVDIIPSAMAEVAHWQRQGYGLVIPQVHEKRFSTEEIR